MDFLAAAGEVSSRLSGINTARSPNGLAINILIIVVILLHPRAAQGRQPQTLVIFVPCGHIAAVDVG